jgi:hypothetical protein
MSFDTEPIIVPHSDSNLDDRHQYIPNDMIPIQNIIPDRVDQMGGLNSSNGMHDNPDSPVNVVLDPSGRSPDDTVAYSNGSPPDPTGDRLSEKIKGGTEPPSAGVKDHNPDPGTSDIVAGNKSERLEGISSDRDATKTTGNDDGGVEASQPGKDNENPSLDRITDEQTEKPEGGVQEPAAEKIAASRNTTVEESPLAKDSEHRTLDPGGEKMFAEPEGVLPDREAGTRAGNHDTVEDASQPNIYNENPTLDPVTDKEAERPGGSLQDPSADKSTGSDDAGGVKSPPDKYSEQRALGPDAEKMPAEPEGVLPDREAGMSAGNHDTVEDASQPNIYNENPTVDPITDKESERPGGSLQDPNAEKSTGGDDAGGVESPPDKDTQDMAPDAEAVGAMHGIIGESFGLPPNKDIPVVDYTGKAWLRLLFGLKPRERDRGEPDPNADDPVHEQFVKDLVPTTGEGFKTDYWEPLVGDLKKAWKKFIRIFK